jgi:hypothetical protein
MVPLAEKVMETQPGVARSEGPNERQNAVALTVLAVITVALAVIGTGTNFAAGIWVTLCGAMLAMAATCEGIPFGGWRRSAAILTAGVAVAAVGVKLFSLDLTVTYKVISYVILAIAFVLIGLGMKLYLRDASASFAVTLAMFLVALVTVAVALLTLGMKLLSYDFAAFVIVVGCVAFSGAVTVTALSYGQWAGSNTGPTGGAWQAKRAE